MNEEDKIRWKTGVYNCTYVTALHIDDNSMVNITLENGMKVKHFRITIHTAQDMGLINLQALSKHAKTL